MQEQVRGYLALCYHYIRPPKAQDPFPRILGTRVDGFLQHLDLFQRAYEVLSLADAWGVSYGGFSLKPDRDGLLLTFDDGLADHYQVAQLLAERGIRALFFLPTCVLQDALPANPTIVHYGVAAYGIGRFVELYRAALEAQRLPLAEHDVRFQRGQDPWAAIATVKQQLTYRLRAQDARQILLEIYRRSLLADDPDVLGKMHLTQPQVAEMLRLGHAIGVHSHSHVSVGSAGLAPDEFTREVVAPKAYLEETFGVRATAFSYPFGERQDCLSWEALLRRTTSYTLAFTVEERMNTRQTSPFELGRLMPMGSDTAETIYVRLQQIRQGTRP